ncbi:MAG: hypothetical protein NTX53_02060 [candidate division WOR-3 bacterium]|nr:hypothetical protein [candidate division WOR-3 bacterium]
MEILKFAIPAATGLMGVVKLFDKGNAAMRVVTTVLIMIGGAGSVVLVQQSGRVEERRAIAAEQAQQRAEVKLDRMTDALLGIQQDLAGLQVQLAKAPQGSTGSAGAVLKATLQKVADAKQIVRAIVPAAEPKEMPTAPISPAHKPATKSDAVGR